MANEFFKELQKLYTVNRKLVCNMKFENGRYKIEVYNKGKLIFNITTMSAYNAFDLAYSKLGLHREELL